MRVVRAHGSAGYPFGAFAILTVLPPGKNTSRAQLCARSASACQTRTARRATGTCCVPPARAVTAIHIPPGSTAFLSGAGQVAHEGVEKEVGNEREPGPTLQGADRQGDSGGRWGAEGAVHGL